MKKIRLLYFLIFALVSQSIIPASPAFSNETKFEEAVIKLTFLGTGAPRPSLERYGPSILVEAGQHRLIVDAGSGMRERLFEAGGFELITGVKQMLVTHLHFDHTISIPGLWLTGWLYGRRVPLHVFGPTGTEAMMKNIERAYAWDVAYRGIVGVPLAGAKIVAQDVSPGAFFDEGGLKITAFDVEHMPIDVKSGQRLAFAGQTLGFRIDYKGRSVVFSGDTRSTKRSALLEHGAGVDVLIHEVQVPSPGNSREARLANVSLSVHSTPEQVAYIFDKTRPGMAVYSHIIPPGTRSADLIKATRSTYTGPLTVAHDLMMITVGESIEVGTRPSKGEDIFEKSSVLK